MSESERALKILETLERLRDEARDKARKTKDLEDQAKWEALSDALAVVDSL
jgi:hypothetical protein